MQPQATGTGRKTRRRDLTHPEIRKSVQADPNHIRSQQQARVFIRLAVRSNPLCCLRKIAPANCHRGALQP